MTSARLPKALDVVSGIDMGPPRDHHGRPLRFICWGAEDGGAPDGVGALIGSITGKGGGVIDPLVRAAAANAVKNAPKTDGIFVVAHDTDAFNILVYKKRKATVAARRSPCETSARSARIVPTVTAT